MSRAARDLYERMDKIEHDYNALTAAMNHEDREYERQREQEEVMSSTEFLLWRIGQFAKGVMIGRCIVILLSIWVLTVMFFQTGLDRIGHPLSYTMATNLNTLGAWICVCAFTRLFGRFGKCMSHLLFWPFLFGWILVVTR